ncbi:MAG TPA: pyruvate dehydrogenase (acetyl-transferring), homodimeric type, partial [Phycisphaerae bacterium]|nr:pyruvate dehydrogenase (acetyl-transferring), homodimeric type [Phycisphaerae bacterium]
DQIRKLLRGGHDPMKVYAAYKTAVEHTGTPTVILAKTVKGYGLGEAGEGRNITHQQKKLNERELREFRTRFDIPLPDEEVVETPFYRPPLDSPETQYLLERRKELRGFVPERKVRAKPLGLPEDGEYAEFLKGSGDHAMSTTMAAVRILTKLLRHGELGKRIVPIIPDEARTFGMDSLFRQIGIYSPKGQLYEPVDRETLLYYNEAKDGQILEEGITEAGSMSSFIAAGTAYANVGIDMVPFYFYYSMFGFQRIGDLIWAAADSKTKGFLLGATAGRTTLNGEGLQHQDGHSHLLASTVPTLFTYDAAFGYEIALIIKDGLRRLYGEGEEYFYYLTLYNESYNMPAMPAGAEEGILKGLYKLKPATKGKKFKAHILGSGPLLREALRAQEILAEQFDVSADVWSATSYKLLRGDALRTKRWNMLHPTAPQKKSYLESILQDEEGAFVAVSDYMKMVPDQIAPWVPGGLMTLGTDGFGRSDTRANLRRFFEVDAELTTVATLYALYQKGLLPAQSVDEAIKKLGIDPEKSFPFYL